MRALWYIGLGGLPILLADETPKLALVKKRFRPTQVFEMEEEEEDEPEEDIVVEDIRRRWWGFPNYEHQLDMGPSTWSEFARRHGNLGRTCTAQTARRHCGTEFVCKDGVCNECTMSRDCGEQYRCEMPRLGFGRRMCMPRHLPTQWTWREVACTVLIVITAVLSAAAGMGGGGVYVPLLLLMVGLSTKEAVPLSQSMVFGGSVINILMFCGQSDPRHAHRPKIDYEVVMMLNPGLAAGVTVGVIANVISPQWIIVVILIVTLILALHKSLTKGIAQWKKEAQTMQVTHVGTPKAQNERLKITLVDFGNAVKLGSKHKTSIGLLLGCWLMFLGVTFIKAPACSMAYWGQLLGLVLMCGVFTYAGTKVVAAKQAENDAGEGVTWTASTMRLYPVLSTTAGFLGGFLGIGGGIIMGPLLLELGVHPEVSQATTAMFVFLSSSLATIRFMVMGKAMPMYCLWFTSWVILATFVGQTVVDYVLRRWKRSSLIVLSIAAIIAFSLVMMTVVGIKDILADIQRGADMGFTPRSLCQ